MAATSGRADACWRTMSASPVISILIERFLDDLGLAKGLSGGGMLWRFWSDFEILIA
jgi:hypothetical protein